jgi:hypothetical protein
MRSVSLPSPAPHLSTAWLLWNRWTPWLKRGRSPALSLLLRDGSQDTRHTLWEAAYSEAHRIGRRPQDQAPVQDLMESVMRRIEDNKKGKFE